jgi:hypothetical protein
MFLVLTADTPVITCQQYELFFKLGDTASIICKIEAHPRGSVMLATKDRLPVNDLVLSEKVRDVIGRVSEFLFTCNS